MRINSILYTMGMLFYILDLKRFEIGFCPLIASIFLYKPCLFKGEQLILRDHPVFCIYQSSLLFDFPRKLAVL